MTIRNFLIGGSWFFALAKIFVILIIIGTIIHYFLFTVFIVDGLSMYPTLKNKNYLLVSRLTYKLFSPRRGEIVVMKFPGDPERKTYVKRIIGLPQEKITIHDGQVFINGKTLEEGYVDKSLKTESDSDLEYQLGAEEYYVMGDNRPNSNDSRVWGALPKKDLIGRANLVFWPLPEFRLISIPLLIIRD